ncbi:hypothetical protein FB00_11250 [Cellulosimicrobium funkei]|uniref:Phage portal protein n=2 Tax=Cellulosimicrobium funkei TaxID=264251 RepID=A0A0H2KM58_9MICO|nr:hypothetical protein FB00_11250 [Cellulosimicrobium funkei]
MGGLPLASSTPNNLATIVLPDILGDASWLPLSQGEAMQIPAVAAARNLISGTIARLPLQAKKDGTPLANQPTWLYRTNGNLAPQYRLMYTVDDLLFYGSSLWKVARGTDGQITDAARVPFERWDLNAQGEILIDNENVDVLDVILFSGPIPGGLLTIGARTIRAARDAQATRSQRLRNPSAVTELHITDDAQLDEEEIVGIQKNYVEALRSANGSVVVTKPGIEIRERGDIKVDLFVEVSNALGVEIAQLLGIPSNVIDTAVATGNTSSLTYENKTQSAEWFANTGLAFWAEAITSRLSMDDCVPRGTYVQFDLSSAVNTSVQD